MYGAEPSHPQELRDAAGVLAIRLDHHGREGRLHMARLKQHGLIAGPDERRMKPLRQRTGLQTDTRKRQTETGQPADQRLRLARDLTLAHDPTGGVENTEAALFQ